MNDQLVHIFDNSTCLTKRQLKDYVTGIMGDEECHAAEVHLNSCPFCSDAVDGMMMHKDEAAQLLADLNPDFLKEHFAQTLPQVHLNAIAVPVSEQAVHGRKKQTLRPIWRTASVAAAILFCTGIVWWYYESKQAPYHNDTIAQDLSPHKPANPQPEPDQKTIVAAAKPENKTGQPAVPVITSDRDNGYSSAAASYSLTPTNTSPAGVSAAPEAVNSDLGQQETVVASPAPAQPVTRESAAKPGPNDARPYYGNALTRNATQNQGYRAAENNNFFKASKDEVPVVAKRYAPPLVDAGKPGPDNAQVHNAPANNLNDVAATSTTTYQSKSGSGLNIGGARAEGTVYVVDGVQAGGKKEVKDGVAAEKARKKEAKEDHTIAGDDLYDRKQYKEALTAYNKDLNHTNKGRRHSAMMGAARCYMSLGQKTKAKQLLQNIIDDGGAQSRQAKKMLRKIDGGASGND